MRHRIAHLLGCAFPGAVVMGHRPGRQGLAAGLRCSRCGRVSHAIWIATGRYVRHPGSIVWEPPKG